MAKKRTASALSVGAPSQTDFIFRGTVQRVKDSLVPNVKPDASTAVVRVDEVLAAPPVLAHLNGRDITVVGRSGLRPGQQSVFTAGSLSFGDEIAVRVTSIQPTGAGAPSGGMVAVRAAAAPLAATHMAVADPVQMHRDLQLKRRLDDADVVVAGTVTDVRMAPETRAAARARTGAGGARASAVRRGTAAERQPAATPTRISEHDPIWHEAVVAVDSVEKGSTEQKQVVVRFPGSNDVRWRNHPKFRPGQQGVFLLNSAAAGDAGAKRRKTAAAMRRALFVAAPTSPGASPTMNATSEPQPISDIEKVRQLLSLPAASTRAARTGATRGRRRTATRKATATRRSRRGK